ncbi:MAG: 2-phospho-L-lactate transferase CofD family protein [Acidobacteria bacterium]|nr:2-phospho-L-lactate transferase CofD family protein [Acidobacteriota bacterium]
MFSARTGRADVRVVLFSGGRGSGALAELVATDPRVALTIAINGYDDGASTGEVRRFLGDALGPSDFRKNASRLARLRKACSPALVDLLDRRLPDDATEVDVCALIDALDGATGAGSERLDEIDPATRREIAARLRRFDGAHRAAARPVNCRGASVGNFVFAGGFIGCERDFNAAVDDYCALIGLPQGLIDNVTDGTNAFLVALDDDDRLLGSEEEIVDARRRNRVKEIFLIDRPLRAHERSALAAMPAAAIRQALEARGVRPPVNPRLVRKLAEAHLIIYAPGTQHSSLFPSYLTPGLGEAVAANVEAIKLLVTNIETDAEIAGSSAVDLVDRAVFYLREQGRLTTPAPCLITHYLLNDPAGGASERPYVPLGRLDSIEDPRLVRVGNYEAGASGRHDAAKVLAPFIEALIARERSVQRVAVVLYQTRSPNKIAQTVLEMVRGGIRTLRIDVTVFHASDAELDRALIERLPFPLRRLEAFEGAAWDRELRAVLAAGRYDYVILFESSGMYNGEDVAGLARHLTLGRLDAVWGSRRLSVRDIHESYRLKYRHNALLGAVSYVGSHALSLLYLGLYGRYISDTLSAARAVRASDVLALACPLTHKLANQYLLSALLGRRAEMLEIPVQFFAISPERVRRTSIVDGVRAMLVAVGERAKRRVEPPREARVAAADQRSQPQAWTES